jgi:hypothetical protein
VRISDNRYSRDRHRYDLAFEMLQLGARPQTVSAWTSLSQYQIRNIADEYDDHLARHRGRPPTSVGWFWKDRRRLEQGAVLACLFALSRVLPPKGSRDVASVKNLALGTRLCSVFNGYLRAVARPEVPFEYALLLVQELIRDDSIGLKPCSSCGAATLIDVLAISEHECPTCRVSDRDHRTEQSAQRRSRSTRPLEAERQQRQSEEITQQVSLFD